MVLTATFVTAEVRGLMTSVTKSDDVGEISVYNAQPYYNVGISDLGGRPFTLHIEFASSIANDPAHATAFRQKHTPCVD